MVDDYLAVVRDIHHIEWVQLVLVVDVHSVGTVLEYINYSGQCVLCRGHNGVESKRGVFYIAVGTHILQEVETEFIQT